MSIVLPALVGICVGIVVGLLGAGGGILSVPILVYLLHQAPHDAATQSLIIVGLTAIVTLIGRRNQVRWKDGVIFGAVSIVGSLAGARLGALVSGPVLMYLFSALLALVTMLMARKGYTQRQKEPSTQHGSDENELAPAAGARSPAHTDQSGPGLENQEPAKKKPESARESAATSGHKTGKDWALIAFTALCTGLLTGFFGVGGGFAVVPALTLVMEFAMKPASATSLLVMIMASAAGLAGRLGTPVHIDWLTLLPFMIASMVGGPIGALLTKKTKQSTLTLLFALLLALVATYTITATALGW